MSPTDEIPIAADERSVSPGGRYIEYELRPADWYRVQDFGVFAEYGLPPQDGHTAIWVGEDLATNTIMWSWMVKTVTLLEGLQIAPAYRHQAGVARRVLAFAQGKLRRAGIRKVLTVTVDPAVGAMADRLGLTRITPAVLHVWDIPGPRDIVRGKRGA